MPDKECTTNLLELSFSVGQLRADEKKPREFLGEMLAILDGWECRKSGDDGKAFTALQGAIDSGRKGRGDNISKGQMDNIWKEYHSLMMAMGYLDLEQFGQTKRAPIPNTGIVDGSLVVENVLLKSGGFTDYRTVKTPKEATPAPAEGETTTTTTTTTDKPKRPASTSGYILFSTACKATEQVQAIAGFGAKTTACADQWNALPPRQVTMWRNRATKANDAARAAFEAEAAAAAAAGGEGETTGRWGYGSEKKRRGASRWTPQNARNSILR